MKIELIEIPEPCTPEMVGVLHRAIDDLLDSVRVMFPFARGDAMSAAMYLIVEAGLDGGASPEKLREDVKDAFETTLADVLAQRGKAN
jgi:hypothetical protein